MRNIVVVLVVMVLGAAARADAPDPSEIECRNRELGDECSLGVCGTATCSHGHPGPDGMIQTTACLVCVPGTPNPKPSHTPLVVGLGLGGIALAGGVWFARRRGKRAA